MTNWNKGIKDAALPMQRTGNREFAPEADEGAMISVWCEWNGWRMAMARVTDLENVCWSQANGAIYAQVKSSKVLLGQTPHTVPPRPEHTYLPVRVIRSEVHPSAFEELLRHITAVRCE
jgi:hypothetical protein